MPTLQEYKTALGQVVGEEKFPLALHHLLIAAKFLTEEHLRQLQLCSQNTERLELVEKWFGGFLANEVKNILVLLAEKNQLSLLQEADSGAQTGQKITVSLPKLLSQDTRHWFIQELQDIYGEVEIYFKEDEKLIGGVKIRVDDKELDYSLKTKLEAIVKY